MDFSTKKFQSTVIVQSISEQVCVELIIIKAANQINAKPTNEELFYLLGGPLEAGDDRVLDFVEILNTLCAIHQDVGAICVRAKAPDLPCLSDVILVLVGQVASTNLEVVSWVDFTLKMMKKVDSLSTIDATLIAAFSMIVMK